MGSIHRLAPRRWENRRVAFASDDAFDGRVIHLAGDPGTGVTVGAVSEALAECSLLIRDAEVTAAELSGRAQQDARRLRDEGTAEAERRIERAAEVADLLVHNAETRASGIVTGAIARRTEEEDRIAAARELARRTIADAEQHAERRSAEAEADAVDVLRRAWDAASTIQQDLLDEVNAEVGDMLRRAEADAALLRDASDRYFQEARRLREDAARVRSSARQYADDVMIAAIHATPEPAESEPSGRLRPAWARTAQSFLRRISPFVVIVFLVLGIRDYVVEPYAVAGTSMLPALSDGDRLLINKVPYRLHPPERGDVVVIGELDGTFDEALVKRVVGLPGETVESDGIHIEIDGRPIQESYLESETRSGTFLATEVPDDHVFVLGDNRPESRDSRHFGPVAVDDIEGRAEVVVWPLNSLGGL